MFVAIHTQILEGTRAKGGDTYIMPVTLAEAMLGERALGEMVADWAETRLVRSMSTFEYVLWWELCDDEELEDIA